MKETKSDHILTAGGIVWKGVPYISEIAVIHIINNGGEWCLPKGICKIEDNGSPEITAIREVSEKTGCRVKILFSADVIENREKKKKKFDFYFHMQVIEEGKFVPGDGVDHLIWLPPEMALKILTFKDQRKLIGKVHSGIPFFYRLNPFRWFKSTQYARLRGSILSFKNELDRRSLEIKENKKNSENIINSSRKLLNEAEFQLNKGNIDEGWKCFHGAQRMEIYSLIPNELQSRAIIIRNEADKLNEWRKKAIYDLLGTSEKPVNFPENESVFQAALLRDEHYNNQAYKAKLVKQHIGHLAFIFIFFGIIFTTLTYYGIIPFRNSSGSKTDTDGIVWGVVLFGLLGGAFSAALKVPSSLHSTRIPELTQSFLITLLRVFIGAVSAFIIYLFLQSGFTESIFSLNGPNQNAFTFYCIAFTSGFSERLVLKALEIVTKEK